MLRLPGTSNLGGRVSRGGKPYSYGLESQGKNIKNEEEDVQIDGIRNEAKLVAINNHDMGEDQVRRRSDQDGAPVCSHEIESGIGVAGRVGNEEDLADMTDNFENQCC
jgi:hypothetical protein